MSSSEEPVTKKARADSSGPTAPSNPVAPKATIEEKNQADVPASGQGEATAGGSSSSATTPAVPPPPPTLYLRCKHIVKPWELLNVFLRDHRHELGIDDLYGEDVAAASSSGTVCLKPAANIRCVYVANSRKPFFLLELPTEEATAKLLGMSEQVVFKGEVVVVQKALAGATVADERKRQEARANPPPANPAPKAAPATATTFVPRIVRR